jgi:hypothetical protein
MQGIENVCMYMFGGFFTSTITASAAHRHRHSLHCSKEDRPNVIVNESLDVAQ